MTMFSGILNKESTPLVSIVVPIYNVEKYLGECLRSIASQTYKNLEIILVDDGSTDSSSAICRKAATCDARFRYFHKDNGGLSAARNYAIDKVTGDWLMYVDSDDIIDVRMVEVMLDAALNDGADMAVCGFKVFYAPDDLVDTSISEDGFSLLEPERALAHLYSERSSGCAACAKLAKTQLWRNVTFPEGRRFEDFPRIHTLFFACGSVVVTDAVLYFYRKRSGSITSSMGVSAAADLLESINELESALDSMDGDLRDAARFKCALEATRAYTRMDDPDSLLARKALEKIKYHAWRAQSAKEAGAFQKIRIGLTAFAPKITRRLSSSFLK